MASTTRSWSLGSNKRLSAQPTMHPAQSALLLSFGNHFANFTFTMVCGGRKKAVLNLCCLTTAALGSAKKSVSKIKAQLIELIWNSKPRDL
jgi:hypothetical protein